jgi:hypothetical protein
MLMSIRNKPAVYSVLLGNNRPAKPSQRITKLGLDNRGELLIEDLRLAGSQRAKNRRHHGRSKRQRTLNERQPDNGRTTKEQIDSLDQQRRAVLEIERSARCRAQLKTAVTAKRYRPSHGRPTGADDRCPIRLEPDENPVATLGNNRSGKFRAGDTNRSEPRAALALGLQSR